MIEQSGEISSDIFVEHGEDVLIRIGDIQPGMPGKEETHRIGKSIVRYSYLNGGGYPPGTLLVTDEQGFIVGINRECE